MDLGRLYFENMWFLVEIFECDGIFVSDVLLLFLFYDIYRSKVWIILGN